MFPSTTYPISPLISPSPFRKVIWCIIAPGCGKSTLSMIAGLIYAEPGSISLGGEDISQKVHKRETLWSSGSPFPT